MKRTRACFGAALLACAVAAPAAAQRGNGSDISGANLSSSALAGGLFTPSNGGLAATFNNSSAVQTALLKVSSSLSTMGHTGRASGGGVTVSGGAGQAVGVLMSANPSTAVRAQVVSALVTSGAPATVRDELMGSVEGLLADPKPENVRRALAAFNGLVNASHANFLGNPPQEFLAIYAVLSQLVTGGNAAAN
jgi:hypothetical protein